MVVQIQHTITPGPLLSLWLQPFPGHHCWWYPSPSVCCSWVQVSMGCSTTFRSWCLSNCQVQGKVGICIYMCICLCLVDKNTYAYTIKLYCKCTLLDRCCLDHAYTLISLTHIQICPHWSRQTVSGRNNWPPTPGWLLTISCPPRFGASLLLPLPHTGHLS